jgi:haloalkane dehalogenase
MKLYNPVLYPFQSQWININGNVIHYIDEGKGELILFFHPPIASSFMYRHMIKSLRSGYRCVAIDFPGFGLSSITEGFELSIQSLSTIVRVFINSLRLNNFYIVSLPT